MAFWYNRSVIDAISEEVIEYNKSEYIFKRTEHTGTNNWKSNILEK